MNRATGAMEIRRPPHWKPRKSRNSITIDSPCQFLGGKARKILLFVDFITPTHKIGGNRPEREAFVSTPRSASESAGQWQTRRRVRLPAGPSPQASSGGALMGGLRLGPTRSAGPMPTRLRRFKARSAPREPAGGVPAGGVSAGGVSAGDIFSGGVPAGGASAGGVSAGGVSAGGIFSGGVLAGGVFGRRRPKVKFAICWPNGRRTGRRLGISRYLNGQCIGFYPTGRLRPGRHSGFACSPGLQANQGVSRP